VKQDSDAYSLGISKTGVASVPLPIFPWTEALLLP